ncbi:hypothetical protein N7U66_00840 [Lacinutrix neustonica]|uniref:Uncharacterized protein n=1 Tax=Lacinutrix neustonica TaxID=2980107 RepID=A0A9E8MVF4_9FLAO|nr:hypothetical protein [Lacinutrix neustonica]WAC02332.1 hypothetical protein N7U66_00840 [Lacinutrix neustonica]
MKNILQMVLLLSLLLFNCKGESTKKGQVDKALDNIPTSLSLPMELNNGEKWVANLETHTGVKQMDSLVKAFHIDSTKNYKRLGENFSKQSSDIIKQCSMEGKPHEQLHVVLIPMLDAISTLKETNTEDQAAKALDRMELLINTYFAHFTTE